MIVPLVFRHASQCLTLKHTKSISLADLIFPTYNLAQQPGETSHDYTPCFSTAVAAAPPSAPRRILGARGWTALHYAAVNGHAAVVEQLISAGATVDAANLEGRGPGRVFDLFWEWLWRGDGRGSYIGRGFSFFALGCWVVFVRVV